MKRSAIILALVVFLMLFDRFFPHTFTWFWVITGGIGSLFLLYYAFTWERDIGKMVERDREKRK